MQKHNKTFKLAAVAMLISMISAASVGAQDVPKDSPEATKSASSTCFFEGEKIVDNTPKHENSKREQEIVDKTVGVIKRFETQKDAFSYLDKDHNCQLDRSEISRLLSYAKINGFVRVIASGRLINRYDLSHDGAVQWREFHHAIDKALAEESKNKPTS